MEGRRRWDAWGDVAVFCDSDDTHTTSISYFKYARLEWR
jgi:hypothetical protein